MTFSKYYIYVYEVLEVLENIPPEERERLPHIDYFVHALMDRAAFGMSTVGHAWASQVVSLLKKAYPEREYTYRRIRLHLDPDPPYAIGGMLEDRSGHIALAAADTEVDHPVLPDLVGRRRPDK